MHTQLKKNNQARSKGLRFRAAVTNLFETASYFWCTN